MRGFLMEVAARDTANVAVVIEKVQSLLARGAVNDQVGEHAAWTRKVMHLILLRVRATLC
jgi:hypothetical protein